MADKRQSFRFRFPWRNSGRQVEPEPRPTAKPQSPAQPTTTVLAERPPFRPAGKAPVKASPSQAPPRTEPPPPSPSRAATESQKTSATTQIQVESFPPSPSRLASTPQAATQVPSQTQSQLTTQQSSQRPSFSTEPSSPASQPEPNTKITSETISNAQKNTPTTQQRSQLPFFSTEPSSPASQPEPNTKTTSETISNAQNNTPTETHATSAEAVETISSPEKLDPDTIGGDHKHLSESEREPKEHQEGEKVVQVLTKEEKITGDQGYSAPMQDRVTQLHTAGTDSGSYTKDPLGVGSQAEQRHKKQETFDRKETLATPSCNEKPIKTVSSTNPKDRSTSKLSIQKPVSSTGEQAPPPPKEIREDIMKLEKLVLGHKMLEKAVSVTTLTGENRGASMQSSSEPAKKEESVHIHRSYNPNPDDSPEASSDDGEVSNEGKGIQMSKEAEQRKAYINSNVQSINNSIVFSSSVTDRSPGVQAVFSQNTVESKSNGKSDPLQTHKAQFTKTPAEKLTHESTVRRRCLRGLFMESSDSDSDNPEKPRRHGCRYNCGEKRKDAQIGIL